MHERITDIVPTPYYAESLDSENIDLGSDDLCAGFHAPDYLDAIMAKGTFCSLAVGNRLT